MQMILCNLLTEVDLVFSRFKYNDFNDIIPIASCVCINLFDMCQKDL
jgi:hypothetical protein